VVQLLTKLTKKLVSFGWWPDQKRAFAELKEAFTTALVLAHFDHEKEIVLETDTLSYISAGVLSQYNDQGVLHSLAFFSKKHSPTKENTKYTIKHWVWYSKAWNNGDRSAKGWHILLRSWPIKRTWSTSWYPNYWSRDQPDASNSCQGLSWR
jgi:hypothetical protein